MMRVGKQRGRQPGNRQRGDRLDQCYRQVFITQCVLAALAIVVAGGFADKQAVYATVLGASLAIANSWLAKRAIIKTSALVYRTPQYGMAPVFLSLIQRLALFAGGIGLGLVVWQLSPLYMLGAYIWLQLAYFACKMTVD